MKILIIFLLVVTLANSQNIDPIQHQFTLNGVTQYLSSDSAYFNLTKPILGFHWGDEAMITKTLLFNQCDTESNSYRDDIPHNTLLFIRSFYNDSGVYHHNYTHCKFDNNDMFGKSLCYDPALNINPANLFELNVHTGDPQNPIFGFLKKRGRVPTNPSDPNYSRLIIDSTSLLLPSSFKIYMTKKEVKFETFMILMC